jgi:hypothetical protein
MNYKLASSFTLFCLLSACRPADGAVLFIASTAGDIDTATIDVRDLTSVNFEAFLGQAGVPVASEGDCDVFNGNRLAFDQIEVPGVPVDVGQISMTGASAEPLVDFVFDVDAQTYVADPNNNDLFLADDKITLAGEGSGVIKDFDKSVNFPQETILVEVDQVVRGLDLVVNWNPSDLKAESVSVVFVASNLVGQDVRSIVCTVRDNGQAVLPGALTNLLPTGGLLNSLFVARVNGPNLLLDLDGTINLLEKGKEFLLMAFSSDFQTLIQVNDP